MKTKKAKSKSRSGDTKIKKIILVIALIIIAALIGTGIFIFCERQLIPEGYTIEYTGGGVSHEYLTSFTWEEGRSMVEFNPDYPDSKGLQYLLIDTEELEAILKTARCRATFKQFDDYFSGDIKYQLLIVIRNGDDLRHVMLVLGTESFDTARKINYRIINADDIISALDSAASKEVVR